MIYFTNIFEDDLIKWLYKNISSDKFKTMIINFNKLEFI